MTRDVTDRLATFLRGDGYDPAKVKRLALNFDQVQQYNPPPNPAKITDSRSTGYIERFGSSSWELDALEPSVLVDLVQDAIDELRDADLWQDAIDREEADRATLTTASSRWAEVAGYLAGKQP